MSCDHDASNKQLSEKTQPSEKTQLKCCSDNYLFCAWLVRVSLYLCCLVVLAVLSSGVPVHHLPFFLSLHYSHMIVSTLQVMGASEQGCHKLYLCHLATGRIRATQLDYSEAHRHLLQVMAGNKQSAECLSSSVVLVNFPLPPLLSGN